jgi:hypothetical protein
MRPPGRVFLAGDPVFFAYFLSICQHNFHFANIAA